MRLGVDVGAVRVGVARSDPHALLATPVETVPRDLDSGSDLDHVAALAIEWEAVEVVVGLPLSLDGSEGPAARSARSWAADLVERLSNTPVRLVDERLTTVDAHRSLRDSGVAGRAQRAVIDQAAAVLILQTALDTERATGTPPGQLVGPGRRRKPRRKG